MWQPMATPHVQQIFIDIIDKAGFRNAQFTVGDFKASDLSHRPTVAEPWLDAELLGPSAFHVLPPTALLAVEQ